MNDIKSKLIKEFRKKFNVCDARKKLPLLYWQEAESFFLTAMEEVEKAAKASPHPDIWASGMGKLSWLHRREKPEYEEQRQKSSERAKERNKTAPRNEKGQFIKQNKG